MPDFVSTPPTRKERIPVVTLGVLIDALVQYLPNSFDYIHHKSEIWPEREFGISKTTIYFYDKRRVTAPIKAAIEVEISGKFAQSASSRLFSEPFIVGVWERPEVSPAFPTGKLTPEVLLEHARLNGNYSGLLIIPQSDRSLRFRPIHKWDRGVPIFED